MSGGTAHGAHVCRDGPEGTSDKTPPPGVTLRTQGVSPLPLVSSSVSCHLRLAFAAKGWTLVFLHEPTISPQALLPLP